MFGEGGCSCGEVRYGLKTKPIFVNACHCRLCQRVTGGAFVMNAVIEKDEVELLSGTPVSYRLQGGSGSDHDVYFCRNCGTYVWSQYHRFPGSAWFIRVGTLDNPDLLAPDAHIYTRSKHPAVPLPTDVPAFEEFYNREELWPAESLARLKAMMRTD